MSLRTMMSNEKVLIEYHFHLLDAFCTVKRKEKGWKIETFMTDISLDGYARHNHHGPMSLNPKESVRIYRQIKMLVEISLANRLIYLNLGAMYNWEEKTKTPHTKSSFGYDNIVCLWLCTIAMVIFIQREIIKRGKRINFTTLHNILLALSFLYIFFISHFIFNLFIHSFRILYGRSSS